MVERARPETGRFATKPRPAIDDRVDCKKCSSQLTRADFHPSDLSRLPGSWCKSCAVKQTKRWRHNNRDRAAALGKRGNLKANYGMSTEEYDAIFAAQGGACAVCRGAGTRALAVDHCHSTGRVRGLLCDSCNNGIGRFRDNPALLRRAADYLNEATLDKNDGHKGAHK